MKLAILATFLVLPGCCTVARAIGDRSCYPECPPTPPAQVVEVEKPCELPPRLRLPAVTRAECPAGSPEDLVCYDTENAARIAERDMALKDWIREARTRCEANSPGGTPPSAYGAGSGGDTRPTSTGGPQPRGSGDEAEVAENPGR